MSKLNMPVIEVSQLKRMQSIIENECFMLDIEPEFVSKGCEFAGYEYQQSFDFVRSVDTGIAIAKKCQYNAKTNIATTADASLILPKYPRKYNSI